MKINSLRQSMVGSFENCQFDFFNTNVLGLVSLAGKKALLGTVVHWVTETLAKHNRIRTKIKAPIDGKRADPYFLLSVAWERFKKEESHRFEFLEEDYKFCVKSIDKVMNSAFNPLKLKILATEQTFDIPFTDEFNIKGTIDLITEIDKDTIEIVDWKTGMLRKDWATGQEKDINYFKEKDIQVKIYDYAVSKLYPNHKHILTTIFFINAGGPFSVAISDEERLQNVEIIKEKFNKIKQVEVPTRLKEEKPHETCFKCDKICYYGRTILPHGYSICDTLYYYMKNNGVDATIEKVQEMKKAKGGISSIEGKTSNRRNASIKKEEAKQ